jgi:Predicted membrane protein
MMSQNRQEEKDRLRAENDYKVNLKTEILIEDLYDKVNAILAKQLEMERQLQAESKKYEEKPQ